MRDDLRERFNTNLARAENFYALYVGFAGTGAGRAAVSDVDILRAAVVFMHAAVEDLLRTVAYEQLPLASPTVLAELPIPTVTKPQGESKVTLGQLAQYRTRSIIDLIKDAVDLHLERKTYNNVPEILRLLEQIGVSPAGWDNKERANINAMMTRRHQIVHRVDWNQSRGQGHHPAVSLRRSAVDKWLVSARRFGEFLIAEIEKR